MSPSAGEGRVYFGSGPDCQALAEVATQDRSPATALRTVSVTGNDLPRTVGDNGIQPNTTYWYETATTTRTGEEMDKNSGQCYKITTLSMR